MENYFIFDESELVRIGVVCPDCNTESVFDLGKDQTANKAHDCPGCDAEILPAFRTEARQDYNWITYYQRGRGSEKKAKLLFYFKKP